MKCGNFYRFLYIIFFYLLFHASLGQQNDYILKDTNSRFFVIENEINLKGQTITLPANMTLYFKGGCLKNGIIVGNNTKISGKTCQIFDAIEIKGTWIVPAITTDMFVDLSAENGLNNVFALANPSIHNKIEIKEGYYTVNVDTGSNIIVSSNSVVILDGDIHLIPNAKIGYNIVTIKGSDISLSGKGTIFGDKFTHKGADGQWGMGIMIKDAHNVVISGIRIRECWGDCIYIGYSSTNITIEKCVLTHGRRQGISITSANNVEIKNTRIYDVGGQKPQFAIDIEPNKNDTVDNIVIDNVKSINCYGGFKIAGREPECHVGYVTIKNCSINGAKAKYPLELIKCAKVNIIKNKFNITDNSLALYEDINIVYSKKNVFYKDHKSDCVKIINCKHPNINDKQITK